MKATYIDHMGTDLSVVNAARVSFSKKSKGYITTDLKIGTQSLSDGDKSLIQFLARGCTSGDWERVEEEAFRVCEDWIANGVKPETTNDLKDILNHIKNMPTHWTPFGHTAITMHIKAPIFVARQLGKHQVGLVWNEVSRRYVTDDPEFYRPVWRMKAVNVKQGSGPEFDALNQHHINGGEDYIEMMANYYQWLLDGGVCPEQARMVLPQSMYTEWYWTGNLYAFANVFIQRTDSHAQKEVRDVAHQIGEIIEPLFPVSWKALTQ